MKHPLFNSVSQWLDAECVCLWFLFSIFALNISFFWKMMHSIGFLGPAFFLTRLSHDRTPDPTYCAWLAVRLLLNIMEFSWELFVCACNLNYFHRYPEVEQNRRRKITQEGCMMFIVNVHKLHNS